MILAQLPDPQLQPLLYAKVTKYMLHGPCGIDNPQAKCMVNRKCSKHFSKKYRERTTLFYSREYVMNIEWDYNYYQPWSDNE